MIDLDTLPMWLATINPGKSWACMMESITHDQSGRQQVITLIDTDTLPMWLATIEEKRVKPPVRPKLIRYQLEAT